MFRACKRILEIGEFRYFVSLDFQPESGLVNMDISTDPQTIINLDSAFGDEVVRCSIKR